MIKLTENEFKKIVSESLDAIPIKFLQKLENVEVTVENRPSQAQRRKLNLHQGRILFGLYEGVPQSARGNNYTAVLPDKITIFKGPIELVASTKKEVEKIVGETVWHEIAHHFGMDEKRVRRAETRRTRKGQ